MILTTVEQWRNWSSTYTMLPYVIKLGLAEDRDRFLATSVEEAAA